ncbi:MAG: peptidoglycan-binding domain-containing protein [Arachnia sp.]
MRVNPVTALAAIMVVLALGAWLGATLTTTPREAALKAEAPPPSMIVAQVESRTVTQEIVTRGTVRADRTVSALAGHTPAGATLAVVSQPLPQRGDTFEAGAAVAEISGRPVILLAGTVPMYRPLGPGATGPDVTQLQEALRALGQEVGDPKGSFGETTLAAARALYADAGYELPPEGIPLGEVVFVPGFPATATTVAGEVGALAADAQLVLASGRLAVTAAFPTKQHSLLGTGDVVVISSELLGEEAKATIGRLDVPAPSDEGAVGTTVEILPDEPLPSSWADQGVRVRVITAASQGDVLAVPVGGVFMSAQGSAEVAVITEPSTDVTKLRVTRVPVAVGAIGGGFAEVSSDNPLLAAGADILLSTPPSP